MPGWAVWRLGEDGPTLHQLRHQLLQRVAEDTTPDNGALPADEKERIRAALERQNFLRGASEMATSRAPTELTVRDLLKTWGLEDRDRTGNAQIAADLANYELVTVPDFRAVSLEQKIRIISLPELKSESRLAFRTGDESEETTQDMDDESNGDVGLTLGQLLPVDHYLEWVPPSASFAQAITIMQLNDYSQLAVLANERTLHGAVSWRSIAQAKNANPDASFSDAIDRAVRVFDYDTRLLDALRTLQEHEFIFVRDHTRRIIGIITATDVVSKYDETATPFFLIGEIDQGLRQLIQNTFDGEAVRKACSHAKMPYQPFDAMSIGHYKAVLEYPDCWEQLGWRLDRNLFIKRLDEIRKIRNKVMHFNADTIRPAEVDMLRNFLVLIRAYNR